MRLSSSIALLLAVCLSTFSYAQCPNGMCPTNVVPAYRMASTGSSYVSSYGSTGSSFRSYGSTGGSSVYSYGSTGSSAAYSYGSNGGYATRGLFPRIRSWFARGVQRRSARRASRLSARYNMNVSRANAAALATVPMYVQASAPIVTTVTTVKETRTAIDWTGVSSLRTRAVPAVQVQEPVQWVVPANCPDGLCPLVPVTSSQPKNPATQRRPGASWVIRDGLDVWSHLMAKHADGVQRNGVNVSLLSQSEAYAFHDNLHNGWL